MADALTAELNLNIKKFTAALNRAERQAKGLGQKGGKSAGQALGKGMAVGVAGAMKKVAANITKTMAAVAAAAGFMFARIIQRSTQEAGQIEAAEMRFNILTGDAEKSNKVLNVLRQTAMKTGITFEAMAGNVGKFMAFGFSPEKAMELNKGILDVGGAVGMTNTDMKLLGVALSQVAAKGVGSMEELRQQIAEKGIPIFKALEEQLGVTGATLNKMIQEGKVSADVVLGLFTDVAKGKGPLASFAGGAAKMATTFQGKIGRMKATWQEFLKRFGAPIIESLKPIMDDVLVILENMIRNADKWGQSIASAVAKLQNITNPMAVMSDSLDGFSKAWDAFVVYAGKVFLNSLIEAYAKAQNFYISLVTKSVISLFTGLGKFAVNLISGQLLVAVSAFAAKLVKSLLGAASEFFAYLQSKVPDIPFLDGLRTNLGMISNFLQFASNAFSKISGFATKIADAMGKLIANPFDRLAGKANKFTDIANKIFGKMIGDQDIFGQGKAKQELRDTLDSLIPRPKPQQETMSPATDTSTGAPPVAAFGGPMLNGKMDQMNNAIMGRSAFSVIAAEAQKASQQREKANGLLKEIRDAVTSDDGSTQIAGLPASLGAFAS